MRSHIDIALADGTDDDGFMEATTRALESLRSFEPDLVLYDAGVDIHQADALGRCELGTHR